MRGKVGKIVGGLLAALAMAFTAVYISSNPEPPPADSSSAAWLRAGPFSVGQTELVFIDVTRATSENNGIAAAPDRILPTTLWYPQDAEGSHPLIIHSHGFVSSRTDLAYLAEQLASYGYVVAAADFPLTSGATEGGANANDVINQPEDISFLIDSIISLADGDKPFPGNIDGNRIGLTGYSLGGFTTSLATYHPRLHDDRIAAAVSIAGLSAVLTNKFYQTRTVPFLMIAGTADALVDHASNAAIIPERISNGELLTIAGGSHLGFMGLSEPLLRFTNNPDSLGCYAVLSNLDEDPSAIFAILGSIDDGIYLDPDTPGVCESPHLQKAAHPGRQQMITQLAVLSFFESVFAENEGDRESARQQLTVAIARDFVEASYSN